MTIANINRRNVITVQMRRKNKCNSVDAINIIHYKNLINSLNRLIIEKSKKIAHIEKEEQRLLQFPIGFLQ